MIKILLMKRNSYDFAQLWISKVINSKPFIFNSFLTSIIKFGLPIDVLFAIFLFNRFELISERILIGYILAFLWLNIVPYLIYYFDTISLPNFFKEIKELLPDENIRKNIAKKYDKIFNKNWYWLSIIWSLFLLISFILASDVYFSKGGLRGYFDIWYILGLATVVYTGILAGIGFWIIIITILAITEVAKYKLNIDPFHPDGLGGLSVIGKFAINTTVLFSTGSLLIPLNLQIVRENEDLLIFFI